MSNKKKWVVKGLLAGQIHIPNEDNNLPVTLGELDLTPYAILVQDYRRREPWNKQIHLGLNIPIETDHVFVAWQEMETFVRAFGMDKDVWISVNILSMTDKHDEWPRDIGFLESRGFPEPKDLPPNTNKWEPALHFSDMKNRVRNLAAIPPKVSGGLPLRNIGSNIERLNHPTLVNDDYVSELIKDYMMGLEEERSHPSLALLYFFKGIERVGKSEYGENLRKGTLSTKTMNRMLSDMGNDLSGAEKRRAMGILRWRHNMSEAHLMPEGSPNRRQIHLCKKIARLFVMRSVGDRIH